MLAALKSWLEHPLTRGLDLDDPQTTELRRSIIIGKPFLKKLYTEWYRLLAAAFPPGHQPVLEIGAGGGFFAEFCENLITSDLLPCAGVDRVVDACDLPFDAGELRGVAMTNVLHHIPQPRRFFAEAARCVRPQGTLAMIEPWMTTWSQWVYTRLHHEPFDTHAAHWEFPSSGPLSDANGALPWIIFSRDRTLFEKEFPQWRIDTLRPFMPVSYLLSGGVSLRALMPGWTYGSWRFVEMLLTPARSQLAMFALIVLTRTTVPAKACSSTEAATGRS